MIKNRWKETGRIIGLLLMISLFSQPAAAGEATGSRVVTDMAGRTLTLKGPVNRLVTTFKPASLCVFCLGLQGKLVGIDTDSGRDPLHRAIYPDVAHVPVVGQKSTGLNMETVVSLKPDLVILYAQKDGRELAGRLHALGIPAIIILPETFDSIKQTLELITRAVGSSGNDSPAAALMDEVLALVDRRLTAAAIPGKEKAYFASPRGLFSTATGNMLQDEIMTRAGLINVAHDLQGYFQDISPEQLIRWDPDIIVISQSLAASTVRRLDAAVFQRVSAVAGGAVYRFPSTLSPWDFPSPLSVLATLWMAEKAYPDHFDRNEVMTIINRFHKELFGRSLSGMNGELADGIFRTE